AFQELLEMKDLAVETRIEDGVKLHLHPTLANILINNLLSNAIRHNDKKGFIRIELTDNRLVMANSGKPLEDSPEKMFVRFKKSNQSNESIGLGLSIVKRICEQNAIHIQYEYANNRHTFTLVF